VAAPPPKEPPPPIKKAAPPAAAGAGLTLKRVEEVQKGRRERIEDAGRRIVISEPGKRFIVKERDRSIIRHEEAERFLRRPGAQSQRLPDGSVETYYVRPDGVRIVTVVDKHGRLLRRFRRHRDGREHNIIDNRRFYRRVGIGAIGIVILNLPPPQIAIPLESYIVDYDSASDDDLYERSKRRRSRSWSAPIRSRRCSTTTSCLHACAASTSTASPSSSGPGRCRRTSTTSWNASRAPS
jgi:hypothetical protein